MPDLPPLLDLLDNAKILQGDRIDVRRVLKFSAGQIKDIGKQAAIATKPTAGEAARDRFSHIATLSLGGATAPCAGLDCRIRHIDQLVPFAALYSDRVYVHNFLSDNAEHAHSGHATSLDERRYKLLDDLQVILRVRPLIEAGLIVPVTATGERCNQCVAVGAFGTGADKRFSSERRRLAARFAGEMSVVLEHADGEWSIQCKAPADLLEHGGTYEAHGEPPEPLLHTPRILERALNGESVTLSRSARRELGIDEQAADDVFGSVIFEMAVSQALGSSFLSDTNLPIEILAAISGDADLARRNTLVQKHITSLVPFAGDLSAAGILKVRQREAESFLTYRQALNRAIDDVTDRGKSFTERDARAIYADVLAPDLARLDRAVKAARKDVVKEVGRSVIGWSAAIGFGMYTGLLPAQLVLAAKALGLTKVVADMAAGAGRLLSPEDAVRKEDLFFLWKIRHLSQGRGRIARSAI